MQGLQGSFHDPAATLRAPSRLDEAAPIARKSSLAARNFAVIPDEVVPDVDDRVEFEPVEAVRRTPPPAIEEEPVDFMPRRVAYPERSRRSSRREETDTEIGATVAGGYVALGVLGFIILAIWHAVGEAGAVKIGRVFFASLMIMSGLGLLMATWANIWLLVIAFRDKIEQGLFCLLVPFYPLLYIFSHWRETRGIFAMCVAPFVTLLLFAFCGGLLLGLAGPVALVDSVRDRVESVVPDAIPSADSPRTAEAERLYRDYIQAMNRYTDELARVQSVAPGQLNHSRAGRFGTAVELHRRTESSRSDSTRTSWRRSRSRLGPRCAPRSSHSSTSSHASVPFRACAVVST